MLCRCVGGTNQQLDLAGSAFALPHGLKTHRQIPQPFFFFFVVVVISIRDVKRSEATNLNDWLNDVAYFVNSAWPNLLDFDGKWSFIEGKAGDSAGGPTQEETPYGVVLPLHNLRVLSKKMAL